VFLQMTLISYKSWSV